MAHFKYNLLTVFLFSAIILFSQYTFSQNLLLKTAGDEMSGYRVEIYKDTNLMLTNTEEFSLHLSNLDLSTTADLPDWKGKQWEGNENRITLKRDSYIPEFDANLMVAVTYEVVSANIVI